MTLEGIRFVKAWIIIKGQMGNLQTQTLKPNENETRFHLLRYSHTTIFFTSTILTVSLFRLSFLESLKVLSLPLGVLSISALPLTRLSLTVVPSFSTSHSLGSPLSLLWTTSRLWT
ncbi:hypothetical protein Syun_012512 [Stephania yunnanensis]|uniref:Uncharacterized protein n=1 Tax=Stephania yunnanensis TaxID=152371 RepID=A0AAP0JZM9_9MAGN